jgi:copper chaperone CopZ
MQLPAPKAPAFFMKILLIIFRFIVSFIQPESELKGAVIQAAGLTCAMCSNAIYKSLVTLPFIDQVEPDLSSSSFVISFKKNTEISPDAIRRKIEDAGFSIASFTWEVVFQQYDIKEKTLFRVRNITFCVPENFKADGLKRLTMTDKYFTTDRKLKQYDRQWKGKQCETLPDNQVHHVIPTE